jgi:hypothetical protein
MQRRHSSAARALTKPSVSTFLLLTMDYEHEKKKKMDPCSKGPILTPSFSYLFVLVNSVSVCFHNLIVCLQRSARSDSAFIGPMPGDNVIASFFFFSDILKTVHFYLVLNASLHLADQDAP